MRHFITVAVLVVIVTALVAFGLSNVYLLPPLASQEGATIDQLLGMHLVVIAFLFALIVVFMVYSIVVFRRKPGETGDGKYIHGNTTLEIIWMLLPLGTVLYFSSLGASYLYDITRPVENEMKIGVVGFQWAWRFDYYGPNGEVEFSTNDLYVPKGQPIRFDITSTDVIHSFWVPEFRVKQDAVPGQHHTLRVTPTEVGTFKVRCAEICGRGHAYMLADVHVMEPREFQKWFAEQEAKAQAAKGNLPAYGKQVAQKYGCVGCHSVDGSKMVGPTWKGLFGKEETLSDGTTVTVDEEYLRRSILDPGAEIVKGYPDVMPKNFKDQLSEGDIEALIAYIKTLK